jgi:hypothetical protein
MISGGQTRSNFIQLGLSVTLLGGVSQDGVWTRDAISFH